MNLSDEMSTKRRLLSLSFISILIYFILNIKVSSIAKDGLIETYFIIFFNACLFSQNVFFSNCFSIHCYIYSL
jgi:hypothetical protein